MVFWGTFILEKEITNLESEDTKRTHFGTFDLAFNFVCKYFLVNSLLYSVEF